MTFDQLIDHYGTQDAAARAIGISQASVSEWKEKGVPLPRQAQYELDTRGRLKADRPLRKKAA